MRRRSATVFWAALGGLAAIVYLLVGVTHSSPVAEDAAILMRYALHLGRGFGYVWNIGESPVDGATDWLGTTLLGLLYALGVPLETGPRLLAGAAHALTVGLVVVIARSGFAAPLPVALASAAFVAIGPARAYVEVGFLTTVFALGALGGWGCVVFAVRGEGRGEWRWPVLYGFAMLLTTLARPEGIAMTGLLLLAGVLVLDRAARVLPVQLRRVLAVMAIATVIGGLVWQHRRFVPLSTQTGLLDAAQLLRRYGTPANVLVTTEAGLLPLHSEWRSIDAWGLNDPRIVSEDGLTASYLTAAKPDVIVFHSYYTPFNYRPQLQGAWNEMVTTLHRFAICNGYVLAGAFAAGPEESHYYFVNPNWSAAGAFGHDLKALRYSWWGMTQAAPELSAWENTIFECQ